jgi:hypothetical protein
MDKVTVWTGLLFNNKEITHEGYKRIPIQLSKYGFVNNIIKLESQPETTVHFVNRLNDTWVVDRLGIYGSQDNHELITNLKLFLHDKPGLIQPGDTITVRIILSPPPLIGGYISEGVPNRNLILKEIQDVPNKNSHLYTENFPSNLINIMELDDSNLRFKTTAEVKSDNIFKELLGVHGHS